MYIYEKKNIYESNIMPLLLREAHEEEKSFMI